MSRLFSSKRDRKNPLKNLHRRLHLEQLEDRSLMSCNTISGFVYYDINNNGLYEQDLGETPIAESSIELHNANGDVVGSTTTDANGFYLFELDATATGDEMSVEKTVTFDQTQTNFNLSGLLDQFDSSLGELQSIVIQHVGSITSEIQVENFSVESEADISGTVSGTLTLVLPNVSDTMSLSGSAGSVHVGLFDGDTDFSGPSAASFGLQTVDGNNTITLTGAEMDAYIDTDPSDGIGQVDVTEEAIATSTASGSGNFDMRVRSTAQTTVIVTYIYREPPCLEPGDYTIVQTVQPPEFFDGKETRDGDVEANSIGTDDIFVTLADQDLVNNNFGERKHTQLSGHVWYDANNDGVREDTEAPIADVIITLEGPNGSMQTTTDANGYYEFLDLEAGTYTVKETQPPGYLDGTDNFGTTGGTVVDDDFEDQIQDITLVGGDNSENNDFGEVLPASIAGHVWFDENDDGIFDATESGIPGATITLTGFDDEGPVNESMQTNDLGEYKFENLRPGTYAINESQPPGYDDGKDAIGTPGGNQGNDVFDEIVLPAGFDGVNNDFGEVRGDLPRPGPKNQGLVGFLPLISKTQRTNYQNISNIDPVLRSQMAFVVAAQITLNGKQPDLAQTYAGVQALRAGTTQQGYIQQLWAGNAHRALQASEIYKDLLNRAPTAAEKAQTIADLKAGATELEVKAQLFVSAEYQGLHASQTSLATALYQDILNITPGTTATQSLIQAMDTQPLDVVVHDLLMSDASIANLIDDTYRKTLRRPATSAEIQTWAPQIQGGTWTLDALSQRLLGSQEFYALAYAKIK